MSEPKELAQLYPQSCPFCSIAAAYPHQESSTTPTHQHQNQNQNQQQPLLQQQWLSQQQRQSPESSNANSNLTLLSSIPSPSSIDPSRVSPAAYVVLSAPRVLAFLDIMPMTRGHLLVTTRRHRRKVEDLVGGRAGGEEEDDGDRIGEEDEDEDEDADGEEGRDVGFWLPLLAKTVAAVTGVSDYNIVQNNGARAAQVVPHVHFHIIPRPESLPALQNKSWTMFGRGQREELDDDDAAALAARMRDVLGAEVARVVWRRERRMRRRRRRGAGKL
ncbi:HIT-like domain-containing protein [Phyllosticta citricarpa]|uniref:HIT-like domain-containing protein n=2 Tax=Phyllosticta TaxID=121621 RepID=A0ABR1LBM0_9PEZI